MTGSRCCDWSPNARPINLQNAHELPRVVRISLSVTKALHHQERTIRGRQRHAAGALADPHCGKKTPGAVSPGPRLKKAEKIKAKWARTGERSGGAEARQGGGGRAALEAALCDAMVATVSLSCNNNDDDDDERV
jgi:hypothetical protein